MSLNEKVKRLLSDTAVLAVGTFLSKLIVFFMLPFYTAYLTPEMYSTADLISQSANLLIPLACLGMTEALFRFAADKNQNKGEVLSTALFLLAVGGAAFLVLSPALFLVTKLRGYVWLVALYVVSAITHALFAQYVRADGKTGLFALQGIFNTLCTVGLNILFLVKFNAGIIGYVLSVVVSNFATLCFIILIAAPLKNVKLSSVKKDLIKQMLRYAVPLIPTTIFWWITNVSDRYIVSYICGDEINGLYAAAYKIPTLIILASAVFNEAWQFFAFSEKDGSDKSLRNGEGDGSNAFYFEKTFSAFATVMFLVSSFLMMLSKPITDILLAKTYEESWRYIPVLLIATAYTALVTFLSSTYALRKKTIMSFVTALIGAVTNIALNLILIPKYEAMGAAVATMLCYFIVFVIRSVNVRKYVKFRIYSVTFVSGAILLFLQCASFFVTRDYDFVVQAIFFLLLIISSIPTAVSVMKMLFKKN